jgi:hypothetical protein
MFLYREIALKASIEVRGGMEVSRNCDWYFNENRYSNDVPQMGSDSSNKQEKDFTRREASQLGTSTANPERSVWKTNRKPKGNKNEL